MNATTALRLLSARPRREKIATLLRRRTSLELPLRLPIGRAALPKLFADVGFTRGAEVGVWKGAYSALFAQAGIHMTCVDPWTSYPAWLDTKNAMEPEAAAAFMEKACLEAVLRLAPLNVTICRGFSAEVALKIPDGSLDFVYIDGNHVREAVLEDLAAWTPKVRRGGIIAGHDYRVFSNKPTIHVVAAVQEWTRRHQIVPWYLTAGDRTPSFLWVKR